MKRTRSARSWVALALLGFVLIATGVIARRIVGIEQNRRIQQLLQQRAALDAQRLRLEGEIREQSSRARLVPLVEQRLNMRVPSPDQVIMLPRGTGSGALAGHPPALPNDSR